MKTKYKYVEFIRDGKIFVCRNHKQDCTIGFVSYMPKWRKWEYNPESFTAYTIDCLEDIVDFIKQLR